MVPLSLSFFPVSKGSFEIFSTQYLVVSFKTPIPNFRRLHPGIVGVTPIKLEASFTNAHFCVNYLELKGSGK